MFCSEDIRYSETSNTTLSGEGVLCDIKIEDRPCTFTGRCLHLYIDSTCKIALHLIACSPVRTADRTNVHRERKKRASKQVFRKKKWCASLYSAKNITKGSFCISQHISETFEEENISSQESYLCQVNEPKYKIRS